LAIFGVAIFCFVLLAVLRGAKKRATVLGVILIAPLLSLNREFQPWMPSGRTVHISSARVLQYDFQVWQVKNDSATEPFTTGLFERQQNGKWQVFMLDFEDTYRPSITLREEGSDVAVYEDGEKLGTFDVKDEVLKRCPDGVTFHPTALSEEPPGFGW
jgi:hypothetical protein